MKNQNKVQYPILGFLIQSSMSGYELKKQMELSVANFMSPSFGNIYPTLKYLEECGFIEATEVQGPRHKKVFTATASGEKHFLTWLTSDPDEPFLARVFFMNLISAKERTQLIQQHIDALIQEIHHLNYLEENYRDIMGDYPYQTLLYGRYIYQKEIEYYQTLLKGEKE